ncbi:hypothetical protein [Myxosarcina sp. GI1]|uniref:hypothetical protein n=1 Tax=Myxosarcina sp. GI1 TaxID=1541065 RepID=UPI00056A201D|nr:hypothetical protein [Myxosarcina sp. GI1]
MADLTLQQRFGSSVSFDETTKILSIDLNNLTDTGDITTGKGLTVTGINANTIDANATKILWTLLLLSQQNQPTDNNDETVGLYITNEGKRNVTRNSVSQFGYRLVATAYKNDTLGTTLDPDEIS